MDKEYILEKINEPNYKPMNLDEIGEQWDLSKDDKLIVEKNILELMADGLIYSTKKGRYISIKEKGLMLGTISTNEKGFGFFQ